MSKGVQESHVYSMDQNEASTNNRIYQIKAHNNMTTTFHYHSYGKECNDDCYTEMFDQE